MERLTAFEVVMARNFEGIGAKLFNGESKQISTPDKNHIKNKLNCKAGTTARALLMAQYFD